MTPPLSEKGVTATETPISPRDLFVRTARELLNAGIPLMDTGKSVLYSPGTHVHRAFDVLFACAREMIDPNGMPSITLIESTGNLRIRPHIVFNGMDLNTPAIELTGKRTDPENPDLYSFQGVTSKSHPDFECVTHKRIQVGVKKDGTKSVLVIWASRDRNGKIKGNVTSVEIPGNYNNLLPESRAIDLHGNPVTEFNSAKESPQPQDRILQSINTALEESNRHKPIQGEHPEAQIRKLTTEFDPPLDNIPPQLQQLIDRILVVNPQGKLDTVNILRRPLYHGVQITMTFNGELSFLNLSYDPYKKSCFPPFEYEISDSYARLQASGTSDFTNAILLLVINPKGTPSPFYLLTLPFSSQQEINTAFDDQGKLKPVTLPLPTDYQDPVRIEGSVRIYSAIDPRPIRPFGLGPTEIPPAIQKAKPAINKKQPPPTKPTAIIYDSVRPVPVKTPDQIALEKQQDLLPFRTNPQTAIDIICKKSQETGEKKSTPDTQKKPARSQTTRFEYTSKLDPMRWDSWKRNPQSPLDSCFLNDYGLGGEKLTIVTHVVNGQLTQIDIEGRTIKNNQDGIYSPSSTQSLIIDQDSSHPLSLTAESALRLLTTISAQTAIRIIEIPVEQKSLEPETPTGIKEKTNQSKPAAVYNLGKPLGRNPYQNSPKKGKKSGKKHH